MTSLLKGNSKHPPSLLHTMISLWWHGLRKAEFGVEKRFILTLPRASQMVVATENKRGRYKNIERKHDRSVAIVQHMLFVYHKGCLLYNWTTYENLNYSPYKKYFEAAFCSFMPKNLQWFSWFTIGVYLWRSYMIPTSVYGKPSNHGNHCTSWSVAICFTLFMDC